jgi:hypothetical protein
VISGLALMLLIPDWDPSAGALLVLVVSGPLFLASCILPYFLARTSRNGIGVVFTVVLPVYILSFGIRAYYLIAFPSVHLFPNFNPAYDMINVHRGLLWAALGMASMTLGYFWFSTRRAGPISVASQRRGASWQELFALMSSGRFIAVVYSIGILGRIYELRTGQNTYLYNSPSFDTFASRADPVVSGFASLLAEFCPLAVGIMCARQWGRGWRNSSFAVVVLMLAGEAAFFSFGLYKWGLIGVLIIPVMALAARSGKSFSVRGAAAAAIFVVVILPVINVARTQLLAFYTHQQPFSVGFIDAFARSSQDAFSTSNTGIGPRYFLDPLFLRLDGVESLAVSDKYLPQEGHALGSTYGNLVTLAVPHIFRGTDQPTYIPWETAYVGFPPAGFTVVPMPAIVEAYLNFDVPGVAVVMFLLGVLYARIDRLAFRPSVTPFAAGLLAYAGWKMLDVEQNLFIVLLPLAKVVAVILALGLLIRLFAFRRFHDRTDLAASHP